MPKTTNMEGNCNTQLRNIREPSLHFRLSNREYSLSKTTNLEFKIITSKLCAQLEIPPKRTNDRDISARKGSASNQSSLYVRLLISSQMAFNSLLMRNQIRKPTWVIS